MFNNKEKKAKKAEEEATAKAEAELQAKYTAKQERRKVEKIVEEVDKSMSNLMARAAEAKSKGYTEMYRNCISFIKVAKARKRQAEIFLMQMSAMQEMQSLSKSSVQLLNSMNSVMSSLGKLSLDKTAMLNSQKDFSSAQIELDKQSANIEQFLSGMEMRLDDSEGASLADSDIEAEIESYIMNKSINNSTYSSPSSSLESDASLESMKKLLED